MLPTPAATRWSSSTALTGARRSANAPASQAGVKEGPSASGPSRPFSQSSTGPGTRRQVPKRRMSLKITAEPSSRSRRARVKGGSSSPWPGGSQRRLPVMRRCTTSAPPASSRMTSSLPCLSSRSTASPVSAAATSSRSSGAVGRWSSMRAATIVRPSRWDASRRRTVSTSGSSGTGGRLSSSQGTRPGRDDAQRAPAGHQRRDTSALRAVRGVVCRRRQAAPRVPLSQLRGGVRVHGLLRADRRAHEPSPRVGERLQPRHGRPRTRTTSEASRPTTSASPPRWRASRWAWCTPADPYWRSQARLRRARHRRAVRVRVRPARRRGFAPRRRRRADPARRRRSARPRAPGRLRARRRCR